MAGGRPTLYTDNILEEAREYVDGGFTETDEVIPTVAGLALHLSVCRDTVYSWASQEEKQQFSDIVDDLMARQELQLLNAGLKGDFNASITKLALTKHGYTDKTEGTLDASVDMRVSSWAVEGL